MKVSSYNPNFTGYKNIFADDIRVDKGNIATTISMQLDNIGTGDLDKYRELKALAGMQNPDGDILSVFYSRFNKDYHFLFMNKKRILWGEELEHISECLENSFQAEKYKELEKIHLKIYSFIAQLTKRIAENPADKNIDNNFYKTLIYTKEYLSDILSNEGTAIDIIRHGLYTEVQDVPRVAKSINHKIMVTMTKFFR